MKSHFILAASLAASACTGLPGDLGPQPGSAITPETCDASRAQALVGRAGTSALATEAMRLTGARSVRLIGPDTAVTMDFRSDRLNIEMDRQNRVTAIRCG